jgi:hypothetical protein
MRQGSSDLSGSQSALACLCVCARAQLGLREFNKYKTDPVIFWIVRHCCAVSGGVSSLVAY